MTPGKPVKIPSTIEYDVIQHDHVERVPLQEWHDNRDKVLYAMKAAAVHKLAQWIVDEGLVEIQSEKRYDTMEYLVNHRVRALKEKGK
jgi:hypothetical protein